MLNNNSQQSPIKAKPVICLMGPTASGKTDLAIEAAARYPVALISVDSVQLYRDMDIGSAKPATELRQRFPHALIDVRNPDEQYSVADFCHDAKQCIAKAHAQGQIPLLVGGTMMYFNALCYGLTSLPPVSNDIKAELAARAAQDGWSALHKQLQVCDPLAARRINVNDKQRLTRALGVYLMTGRPLSSLQQRCGGIINDYQVTLLALDDMARSTLHQRIASRFDVMLKQGVVEETARLLQLYPAWSQQHASYRAAGYGQILQFLAGDIKREELSERAVAATRQLAKRQLTWLRNWSDVIHIAPGWQQFAANTCYLWA